MAKPIEYPLEKVLDIKKRRVEEQERVVAQKRRELAQEEEKLRRCEEERDKVVRHRQDKLNQMRDEMDNGTTSDKIIQMKAYIKVVDERIVAEQKKVADQKGRVKVAEKNLEDALAVLRQKRQEVDKLASHKVDWMKQKKREVQFAEEKEMEEVGQTLYTIHKRRGY